MIRLASIAIAIAGAIVVAGCASPASHFNFNYGTHEPGWQDTGTPTAPVSIDKLARYYVDTNGDLWDDRGRKYQGEP